MSITICGWNTKATIDGINWAVKVSTAICLANGLTDYDVVIKAVDEAEKPPRSRLGSPHRWWTTPLCLLRSLKRTGAPFHPFRSWRPFACSVLPSYIVAKLRNKPTTPKSDGRRIIRS